MEFAIGGLAAACAGIFTNPIEVSKVHLKVSGELAAKKFGTPYKNIFQAGCAVVKREGISALQKGLTSSLCMHLVKYGVKLGTYHMAASSGFTKDEEGKIAVPKSVLVCGLGGLAGQILATPLHVVTSVLHHDAAKGLPHHHSLTKTISHLYKKEGIQGLFKGVKTSVPYAFIATSQLTTFGMTKEWLRQFETFKESKYATTFAAGAAGAVVLSSLMTPFDHVVTNYSNQPKDKNGKGVLYNNYRDCIWKLLRNQGAGSFVRSFDSMFLKIGPHTFLCLVFWDGFKHLNSSYLNNSYNGSAGQIFEM